MSLFFQPSSRGPAGSSFIKNLWNTPSQTEVKIISCIPIDVTDLQQKILHLERQLDEAKNTVQTNTITPTKSKQKEHAVNTALYDPCCPHGPVEVSCRSLDCERCTSQHCLNSRKRKSNVSFVFPPPNDSTSRPQFPGNISYSSQYSEQQQDPPDETYMLKMSDPRPSEHRKTFFKKKKKFMKKKQRAPYVYYAQTNTSSPFVRSDLTEEVPHMQRDVMTRSYLSKMINKQYKPQILGDNLSYISQFSSPICRDTLTSPRNICHYESDACSCCNGAFHNLDDNFPKLTNPQIYMVNEVNTGSDYYDTNQYDLVPVREKPIKIKKDVERPRKKEPMSQIDIKCWPETVQTKKIRYYPVNVPPMINYRPMPQHNDYYKSRAGNPMRKMPLKINRIEPVAKKIAKRRREINKLDFPTNIDTSKSCSIDFGNVYPKINHRKPKVQKSLQPIPILKKNAECLTTVINKCECQTATSNVDAKAADDKTEATLNQIKSILQSVLAEVKVSSQTKSQVSQEKPKKDAVVQKGPSQNNMQGSTLLNSFTYSPYAMNPNPYMTSCSRNLTSNQLNCFPQSALKCFQNFPLFIQTPGRHMCSNCYRNSSTLKSGYIKPATTTATNTDNVKNGHSKETEKLIKEIYKSMALNLSMPAHKDTSQSGYEEMMKSMNDFQNPGIIKETKKPQIKIRNVVQAVSELFIKKDMADTSETLNSTVESKLLPSYNSTRSHLTTTDTDVRIRKERLQKYLQTGNTQTKTEPEKRIYHEGVRHIATTVTASESTSSTSESESDSTVVPPREVPEPKQKKEKFGLFSKMFQSVKLFKQRERSKKKDSESEAATSSDSDDYQTIYSQKIEKNLNRRNRAYSLPKRKTHSKISYKQTYQRDRSPEKKRSPYMEQEYRRYWNERLMFHDSKRDHSSEQPYSSDQTPVQRATTYHRNYEARTALVEPKKPYVPKVEQKKFRFNTDEDNRDPKLTTKGLAWLKKHKMGIHCGEQWKKLILEG